MSEPLSVEPFGAEPLDAEPMPIREEGADVPFGESASQPWWDDEEE
jgi:hypothetical protein